MRSSVFIAAIVFLFPVALPAQTSWQWVNPLPQGNLLNGIEAVSGDTVYAVGDYGTVIRSSNGGTTWLVTPTAAGMVEALFDVDFTSPNVGWAVGVTGQMVHTTDGGHTWQFHQLNTIRDLMAVEFLSPTAGWVCGGRGTVFSTANGGDTWHPETTGVTITLYDIEFADALNGWTVGASGTILATTDGGNTWTPQSSGTTQPLYSISFVSPTVGYIAGAFGKMLKTVNGGATWTPLLTNSPYSLFKVQFTDALSGWSLGAFGTVIRTTNGGLSWFDQGSNTYNDIYGVHFLTPNLGYAAGDYGTLLKTTNGGTTWRVLSTGTKNILYGVHFPNATNGFAVGEEGTFAKSSDGGYTWSELFTGIFQTYYGVWFVDNTTGWIVGDSSVILKTTNGGASWNDQNSHSEETLNSIYFRTTSRGWAVGDFGTILSTTNGGSTWAPQTVASFTSFLKIRFATDLIGWVAGYGGEIFKTTNGGVTWVEQISGTTQTIYALEVIDQNTVYAAGDFGTLLKTTDGGENWLPLPNDFFESFYGIAFNTANTGWVAGDEGTIGLTTNGGATWTRMNSGTVQTLFDVQIVRLAGGGLVLAAGEGGTIVASGANPLPVRVWTGAVDSNWSGPGNWNPAGSPGKSDSIVIPLTARNPVIRSTVQQVNIGAIRIQSGARLTIRNGLAELVATGNINIEGTLEMDAETKTNIVVGKDFVTLGAGKFIPGLSTVIFTGGNALVRGSFHNLTVREGVQLQTVGNVSIANALLILANLTLRPVDTLTILNGDPAAFQGIASTGPGTIRRAIDPGGLAPYRFESPATTVTFKPTGTLPSTITMTAHPGATPPGQGDSVFVRRWYEIEATGGANYLSSLSLRFDSAETSIPIEDLALFRDSAGIIVNLGQTDYLDSDLVAISLDSVRGFSRWYLGRYDFLPKNQFQFTDSLILIDNGGLRDTLLYGAFPTATDGIDSALGEMWLPVAPPSGTFDVRWLVPPTEGSAKDLRDILTETHVTNTYTVRLQPGGGGYPFTLRWNNANFPAGKVTMRDKGTAGGLLTVNMKSQNTVTVTNASITQIEIVHDGPEFFPFAAGWNIISLPLTPTITRVKNLVFPTANSKAFYFDNGYWPDDTLDNGVAYWLKFANAQSVGLDGNAIPRDTIPVVAGWNMIGTITQPVATSSVVQQPSGNVVSSYYAFTNSYTPATTLEPARGYWVKANAAGSLILASSEAAPAASALPPEWEAIGGMDAVTVTDRRAMAQTLRFGAAFPPDADPRAYELPPPPPEGIFDARFADGRGASLLTASGLTPPVMLRGARYPVAVTISPASGSGSFDLVDPVNGRIIASGIAAGTPVLLRDASVASFAVKVSDAAPLPVRYALNQNYPNPFNPATTISFDLPAPSAVTLRVYDILGRTVATLADRLDFPAGRHALPFRADAFGSGLYFCRLEAVGPDGGSRTFSMKMLLLK